MIRAVVVIAPRNRPGFSAWSYGDPALERVRSAARAGDRPLLSAALRDVVRDREDRSDRVAVAAEMIEALHGTQEVPWLEQWCRLEPDDPDAFTVAGAATTLRAWRIRGYALAHATPASRLNAFSFALASAEQLCRRAAAIDKADPTPWVWLLHMARGQQIGPRSTRLRWEKLMHRDPLHYRGNLQAVYSLSSRWGFSPQHPVALAAEITACAPAGSPLHALVAAALVEGELRTAGGEKSWQREDSPARARVDAAAAKLAGANHNRPAGISAFNQMAYWYCVSGQHAQAWPYFEALGDRRETWPWEYRAGSATGLLAHSYRAERRRAARKARRSS
jgi:hypothetical protein